MLPFSAEEDALLWERHGSGSADDDLEQTAALMSRGATGLRRRLQRLREPTTEGHRRLFGEDDEPGGTDGQPLRARLRTALECVQRVLWDPGLTPSEFTVHYRDRFDTRVCSFPMDAPNDSIRGPERLRALALPQHRILYIKYRRRLVWHRQMKLDRVFGSGIPQPGDAAGGAPGASAEDTAGEGEGAPTAHGSVEGAAPARRMHEVVRSYGAWAAADAAARSAAKARARRCLQCAAGRRYGTVEERMAAVGALLSAARDGQLGAADAAAALMDPELFGNEGGTSGRPAGQAVSGGVQPDPAPGDEGPDSGWQEHGEAHRGRGAVAEPEERGEGPSTGRFACVAQELVAAVVPEEHRPMRDALLEALWPRRALF